MRHYVIDAFAVIAFLNDEPSKGRQETDGRSEIDPIFKAVLVVINELEITPKNYPLLMFASSKKKFKEFLLDTVRNNCLDAYVEFAYRVNPQITKEVIEMAGYGLSKEKLEFIANDIGPKLLQFIPKEELLKHLTIEEVIEMAGYGLSKEKLEFIANDIGLKLLQFIPKEELLKHLTIEDLRKRLKELEEQEEKND